MKLCQTHYNKFIINEAHNLKNNEACSHPKHDEYKNETAKICSLCRKKTDSDPDYNMLEEYNAPIFRKKDDSDNILKVGNHNYSFKKDVLYTGEELKQFESDYQEIITQLTIIDEISLIKNMLEIGDADLIGFFDELYQGTNPNTKSDKTNNNNKKKLVSLYYFLASINNKYINGIKANIGLYLETSGALPASIDILSNIGLSVSRKTVN
ncbi:hypothetical protein GLOIN_2v1782579 [Rhizophagus clarus]|uniref:Uncharacterized protein n=1 Tax=Rhizophagus clarus TaxID=94130 RepID=A0A8H3LIJ4_9GLOM|nr:hypothetical protein GLOIN_2v1782579 [Rhizophagus clarus]